jgi:hypothetical protein
MAKICRVVFSSNRLEYLVPTLASHEENIDFGDHDVYNILIDDYPKGRYDFAITSLVKKYNFNELVLHKENLGITKTWTELWTYLATQDFDYIWHHEDDIVFNQKVKIDDLINLYNHDRRLVQVNLKRNPWYDDEFLEPLLYNTDCIFNNYRYELKTDFFWTMASLYPAWVTKEPVVQSMNCNLGEQPVMEYFNSKYNLAMAIVKNKDGTHIIEHIGEYFQGKRVLENEPGWDRFKDLDPNKRYNSKTGAPIRQVLVNT